MSSTAQPTSIRSSSSPQPPTPVVGVNPSSCFHNHNRHQFQPIQRQPLITNGGAAAKYFDASKVNATATHIELEQQSSCNISTILNMSCRGRAEAFARSLQSRLKTLGSQVSEILLIEQLLKIGCQLRIQRGRSTCKINFLMKIAFKFLL